MDPWVNNLQQNSFNGIDNVNIAYASMLQPQPSPAMILVNGRIESYLKYQEIANYFYQQGFSVHMLDHRGQGLSQRMLDNKDKGHVVEFSDYTKDLALFINEVVLPNKHSRYVMLGHSMGGAIVTRYLQTYDNPIDQAILTSPMLGIVLPAPKIIIQAVATLLVGVDKLLSRAPSYVIGGKGYENTPFVENELTQSEVLYREFRAVYEGEPTIKLGSPTNRWLLESLRACQQCVDNAANIAIPTLLLQAGADTIVDNIAQNNFLSGANQALIHFECIEGARHELLFELDKYRLPTLAAIERFLA